MKINKILSSYLILISFSFAEEKLFDGRTLDGWNGDPKFWSVKNGAMVGETTKENPTKGNTFIIWEGGNVGDFDLRLDYKIESIKCKK